ncbi:MAG: ferritin-like domain-containing protein [Candidatus Dormibacteraeota bacterium]|nr:ferritin-like domain-containing protein [Candidatus Dormibacteraeota bacterium]
MKTKEKAPDEVSTEWRRLVGRRSFLKGVGAVGATLPAGMLLATQAQAATLSKGDAAILRFLAAAEIIESDLWQQYAELGGVNGGNSAYILALQNLDGDMPQYITDNTDDEISHAAFLNAYLKSRGAQPVSLEKFRTLPSTRATGAKNKKRLTNLMKLNVDTSWYRRYRSDKNPDLGATFPQAFDIENEPAIPLNDTETPPGQPQPNPPTTDPQRRMQAIANTAGFHFAFIEQGGASLYTTMSLKASDIEVLRIVVSIGGVEVDHFGLWHDKAGNAVSGSLANLKDPITGVTFPDLNDTTKFPAEQFQTNKILPEPCDFISKELPKCSVIRPSTVRNSGAMAAVKALADDQLFVGQSKEFFDTLTELAEAADAAERKL